MIFTLMIIIEIISFGIIENKYPNRIDDLFFTIIFPLIISIFALIITIIEKDHRHILSIINMILLTHMIIMGRLIWMENFKITTISIIIMILVMPILFIVNVFRHFKNRDEDIRNYDFWIAIGSMFYILFLIELFSKYT
ncbi:hypothetical protein CLPU_13c00680 [Gottschalkia purinilytica]|uniref:Uncharacterized protein n=1 Tax=Gottschalkia purinilytica TaxID=1503 RepID=A0A0L0W8E8_GOTPU|nr:hypothetical protein [Gottschalkia purinilytica]KNF07726.1 hypothetical protein CLPU_13c00680 [Gottschalkia purinilytica]